MNDTIEEHRKTAKSGELNAEIAVPKGTTGPIPFVLLLHGCSGMVPVLNTWAHDMAGRFAKIGYGSLIVDSFTSRGVENICKDPSQLDWARRRADDAYSAPNGATTTLLIMNSKVGALHKNKFAGAFPMQPSCLYLNEAEFYAPLKLFLAEKDEATSPVLCKAMAETKRQIPVQYVVFKGAYHAFEDHEPVHMFQGYHVGYNAEAAQGTINGILRALKSKR
jgi:dienelactone hydrolase